MLVGGVALVVREHPWGGKRQGEKGYGHENGKCLPKARSRAHRETARSATRNSLEGLRRNARDSSQNGALLAVLGASGGGGRDAGHRVRRGC